MSRRSVRKVSAAVGSLALALAPAVSGAQAAFPRSPLKASATTRPSSTRSLAGAPVRGPAAPTPVYETPTSESASYAPADAGPQTVRVDTGAGAARSLSLPRGKSAVIELPVDARDVMVSDPKVADVVLSTPRRIYVMGASAGETDALFVDGMGRQILRLDIRVDQDSGAVAQTLARLLPGSSIRVEAANDSLVLSGEAASAAEADRALRLAQSFVADKSKVINLIAVSGGEQVMLHVKIVEVNRTVVKQLGFNLGEVLGKVGSPQYSFLNAATYGVAGSFLGAFTGGYKYDSTTQPTSSPVYTDASGVQQVSPAVNIDRSWKLATPKTGVAGSSGVNSAQSMIQAFERVGLIRTLAEPNLTAVSGESARFLAGGEFPVPVSEDNNGRVTVEFKPYGVGLGFTPVVLGPGRISLKISTEVSELTSVGAFTLSGSSTSSSGITTSAPALVIPGLNVRRAETTVELPSGGAMMIAGLMSSQTKQTLDSLPGLMQLPVLGALFRSRDFQNNESELVVIVTPYLVKAGRPDQMQTPADGLVLASDLETNLLGRLNAGFGKKPEAAAGKTYQGPYGYVVD
jgi:pilus assembly protein CpaC